MIIPVRLKIENFLSFKEEEMFFNRGTTTCIMGRNLTEDNQQSNGSGKSAFQSAIELSLTGDISRDINKSRMVRRGTDRASVEMELLNNVTNETIVINRSIPLKGSELLTISKNSVPVDIPSILEGNKWIVNYIGISKEDISNYFIVNESNYVSFFKSPDTKKKALISRFSNADIIDSVFSNVSADIEKKNSELVNIERESLKMESRIEILREDLERERSRDFEQEKELSIQKLRNSISKSEESISQKSKEIESISLSITEIINNIIPEKKTSLSHLKSSLTEFNRDSFTPEIEKHEKLSRSISESIERIETAVSELRSDQIEVNADIGRMELVLKGRVECPKCSHKFNPSSEITIEEAEANLNEYKDELQGLNEDIQKLSAALVSKKQAKDSSKLTVKQLEDKQREVKKQYRELEIRVEDMLRSISIEEKKIENKKREISSLHEDIDFNRGLIAKYHEQIEEIRKSAKDTSKEDELIVLIDSAENELREIEKKISEKQDELSGVKEWTTNFTLFKSFLANKKLKIIQDMINGYLTQMGCDYKLKLDGYKQLANGELREKITPYIYKDGEICGYGEFSKGERARIDFATLITLQTLINDTCDSGGLDCFSTDEIMEGLDAFGLNTVLESINKTQKTSLITTHVTNDQLYKHILIIEKVNGISKIVN